MNSHVCRRLILFLDGTWMEDTEKRPASNIVYLRERLYWGLQQRLRNKAPDDQESFKKLPHSFRKKAISGMVFDGFEYVVYYHPGVGTGPLRDRLAGGILGSGLEENIRRAYKFLSYWFRPGDEIFVFGFSRGAFTARSLCGYLHAVGLLKREHCNAENEARAWNYYRTPPDDRLSAEWLSFRQPLDQPERSLVHDDRYVRVRVLGVFDTVGALGIPALGFNRFNRSKYQFHDTDVKSTVDIRLHALAIDEPRPEFPPTLWTKPKFRVIDDKRSPTEQVWFPGAHSDIGGGYVKWNRLEIGLSHLTIAWMLQRLKHHLVSTPLLDEDPLPPPAVAPKRHAPLPFYMDDLIVGAEFAPKLKTLFAQHKPWSPQRMIRSASRVINQIALTDSEDAVAEGRVPYADPIGEMIHASALRRIKERVRVDSSFTPYLPKNLIGVIPYVAATYLKKHQIDTDWQCFVGRIFSWKQIRIVGWDGQPLDPDNQDDVTRAFQLLPDPAKIVVGKKPSEIRFMDEYITDAENSGRSTAGF